MNLSKWFNLDLDTQVTIKDEAVLSYVRTVDSRITRLRMDIKRRRIFANDQRRIVIYDLAGVPLQMFLIVQKIVDITSIGVFFQSALIPPMYKAKVLSDYKWLFKWVNNVPDADVPYASYFSANNFGQLVGYRMVSLPIALSCSELPAPSIDDDNTTLIGQWNSDSPIPCRQLLCLELGINDRYGERNPAGGFVQLLEGMIIDPSSLI